MIDIDGSQGEGGGQILRSALALSLVTGQPVTITHIRAGRDKPGLRRQHLAAVRAAQRISSAEIEGAALGSQRLVFRPGRVQAGGYRFNVGSAGSTTLVLQTVLPALLLAEGESTATLQGGTHNPMAPPYDFLAQAYLPLLRRMGFVVELGECRPGFYPVGRGEFSATIRPRQEPRGLHLLERGQLLRRRVRALVANLPEHIADRECRWISDHTTWDAGCFRRETIRGSHGPGNVVLVELDYEYVTEVFAAFGEKGKPAERVAREALEAAVAYFTADVPVGPYLADQLLLPLGLAAHLGQASSFRTMPLTKHAMTHIDVLHRMLDVVIVVESEDRGSILVRLARAAR